jgi:tRNA-binding EMAP/Myf-like protein
MLGQRLLVVCNLKPAKLAGFKSAGMVVCASSEDGKTVEFVEPHADSLPGDRILCEGMDGPAASPNQMQKKKVFQKVADDLRVGADRVATWRGEALVTSSGPCTVRTLTSARLS